MLEASTAGRTADRRILFITRAKEFLWAHPALTVFLIALIVRSFISIVLTRYFSGTLVLDDTTYHQMAADMASGQIGHWDDFTNTLYWSTATFVLPVTLLYKLFGPVVMVAQLLIAVVGSFAAFFVARLAGEFLEKKWAFFAGVIIALLPSQAFWSSMLMKDAFVWFVLSALALTLAVAARATGRKLFIMGIVVAVLLVALSYLRLHTLVVASWALVAGSFFGIRALRIPRVAMTTAAAAVVPLVFGGIGIAGLGLVANAGSLEDRRFQNAIGANTAVVDTSVPPSSSVDPASDPPEIVRLKVEAESLESEVAATGSKVEELQASAEAKDESAPARAARLRVRAARLQARVEAKQAEAEALRQQVAALVQGREQLPSISEELPEPTDELLDPSVAHLPRGLSVMLLEPFPLPFSGSVSLRLARLESLIWYPLLVLAAIGLWRARDHLRALAFPIVAGAGIVVTYALTEGNIGTAHRHRGEFVWVVALLAALGLRHVIVGRRRSSSENA